MRDQVIMITEQDARTLRGVLMGRAASGHDQEHLEDLQLELERAIVLADGTVPADVVTMQSQVRVVDVQSAEPREFVLVFPVDADVSANKISVLAPLGTALLGQREGDEVEWAMPGGTRRLRVEKVMQLPRSASR